MSQRPLTSFAVLFSAALILGCGPLRPNPDGGTGGSGGGAAGGGAGGGGIPGTCTLGQACTNANEQCLLVANGGSTATACVAGACDTVAQNCSNTAQMCTYLGELDGGVNRACVNAPTSGVAQDGDCSAAQCQKGLTCVTLSGQTTPRCLKYCATDTNCDSSHVCNLALSITGTNERPLVCGVRPATCDLLAQNCTNAGDGCYATTSGNVCLPAGTAADGGSCGQSALCVKGQTCVDVNSSGNKCYALCNPDGGSPACSGAACNALTQPAGVGICL